MILTWIRRKLFVSKMCRQPFIESNVLGGKIEAMKVLHLHKDCMSVKPDFMHFSLLFWI